MPHTKQHFRRISVCVRIAAAVWVAHLAACSNDVNTSQVVASVNITPGGTQNLLVGNSVTLTATARNQNGDILTGRRTTWGSGDANVATVSDAGVVTAVAPGLVLVTAVIDFVDAIVSVNVGTAATPVLEFISGNNQLGLTGRPHADSLTVRARTQAGVPLMGASVGWTATGGALSSTTTLTDANGLARVQWTAISGSANAAASLMNVGAVNFSGNGRGSGACSLAPSPQTSRFSLGATDFTLSLRATSPLRIAVLFVDFPGLPATETPASLVSAVIDPGLAVLRELSYNRLNVTTVVFPTWYRMSKSIDQYDWTTFTGHRTYIDEALTIADADINFSTFDALYIFTPPSSNKPISPTFNGGAGSGVVHDGRTFGNAVTFGLDARTYGASVVAHETGHMLGLVDLYTFDASGSPYTGNQFRYIGAWSLMSNIFNAAHYLIWEKRKLGFLEASEFDCLEGTGGAEVVILPNASITPGLKGVAVKLDASRALVVEVRDRTGLDSNLCSSGVLVYEVNAANLSGFGPAAVRGSRVTTSGPLFNKCGPWADATFGVGAGAIDSFTDAASGTTVKVLSAEANGAYRVRIKR